MKPSARSGLKPTYLAVDQYGDRHLLGAHPRKGLLELHGTSHAKRIYRDLEGSPATHVGWVIGGHWYDVYRLVPLAEDNP